MRHQLDNTLFFWGLTLLLMTWKNLCFRLASSQHIVVSVCVSGNVSWKQLGLFSFMMLTSDLWTGHCFSLCSIFKEHRGDRCGRSSNFQVNILGILNIFLKFNTTSIQCSLSAWRAFHWKAVMDYYVLSHSSVSLVHFDKTTSTVSNSFLGPNLRKFWLQAEKMLTHVDLCVWK